MIKILIADDSSFMRNIIQTYLEKHPGIVIVDSVANGEDVLEFIKENDVDVIVMDIFMPKKDGIETLKELGEIKPIPVVLITIANKNENPELYFKALSLGAVDVIPKPEGLEDNTINDFTQSLIRAIQTAYISKEKVRVAYNQRRVEEIAEKMKNMGIDSIQKEHTSNETSGRAYSSSSSIPKSTISTSVVNKIKEKAEKNLLKAPKNKDKISPNHIKSKPALPDSPKPVHTLIIIGASTGGPERVVQLIKNIVFNPHTAVLVIQHMPYGFTESFARRIDAYTEYKFIEVDDGIPLAGGYGYVIKGDYHGVIEKADNKNHYIIKLNQEPRKWGVRPSIDITMKSAAESFNGKIIGIILTGMGRDGAEGIQAIKDKGAITFVQHPHEAFIDSMPNNAIATGCVDYILPLSEIAFKINQIIK